MREQEFGREGVTDMLAPALIGQGVKIAPQEDLTELVRQGEPVTRRLVAPQTLPDGSVGLTMLKHCTAQHARRQRKVIEGGAHLSLIHISEPTRLGMISYAVFCLKKKKQ